MHGAVADRQQNRSTVTKESRLATNCRCLLQSISPVAINLHAVGAYLRVCHGNTTIDARRPSRQATIISSFAGVRGVLPRPVATLLPLAMTDQWFGSPECDIAG